MHNAFESVDGDYQQLSYGTVDLTAFVHDDEFTWARDVVSLKLVRQQNTVRPTQFLF